MSFHHTVYIQLLYCSVCRFCCYGYSWTEQKTVCRCVDWGVTGLVSGSVRQDQWKKKQSLFVGTLWPECTSKWTDRLRGDNSVQVETSVVSVWGFVPSLTPPQESIKAQQVVSEGHSANHFPELSAPRGIGTSPHVHSAGAGRYLSQVRGKCRYQRVCSLWGLSPLGILCAL